MSISPELQAWLTANNLLGGSESDPYNLGDYGKGAVLGNSTLAKRNDESVEDFLSRVYAASMGQNGEWGTAGRNFNTMQNAGFFNELQPFDLNGSPYHRIGEDVSQMDLNRLGPKQREAWERLGVSKLGVRDPTYGFGIPRDVYMELSKAAEQDNLAAEGFLDNPMTLIGIMAAMAGGFGALNGLEGFGAADAAWGVNSRAADSIWGNLYEQALSGSGPFSGSPFTGSLTDFKSIIDPQNSMLQSLSPNFPGAQTPAFTGPGTTLSGASGSWWENLFKNPTSSIGRLLTGNGNIDDILKAGGAIGSGVLGFLGSEAQADASKDVADKYLSLGQPFRAKLFESYMPGFDLTKQDPAFQGAIDQSGQSVMRALSTNGNPYDNPGAMAEGQKYVLNSTILPQLNTYRSQLGGFGQLGVNTAGTADLGGISNAGSEFDAIGYGLGQLTGGDNTIESILKKYPGLLGGGVSLNTGRGF